MLKAILNKEPYGLQITMAAIERPKTRSTDDEGGLKVQKEVLFYNLQDEDELTAILDEKERLEYKKIDTEVSGGMETARYRVSMKETVDAAELWDIFARLFQRNSTLRMRVCNPE